MARLDLSGLEGPALLPGEPARAPLSSFEEDPEQPRTEIEGSGFEELVEDIRERGILQPIVVVKTKTGMLRIRFGARRYRAAKKLDLGSVPYVLSTDARQWDEYAQVSENERRKSLEPLELANFIAKRIQAGDSKAEIARRLGLTASTITTLLVLLEGQPFIKDLYRSGRSRSPQYLYRLSLLHSQAPGVVEERVAGSELTASLLDTLTAQIQTRSSEPKNQGADSRSERVVEEGAPVETRRKRAHQPSSEKTPPATEDPTRIRKPRLLGKHRGRDVIVVLTVRPTNSGLVHVRYEDDGAEAEVPCIAVTMSQLTESTA